MEEPPSSPAGLQSRRRQGPGVCPRRGIASLVGLPALIEPENGHPRVLAFFSSEPSTRAEADHAHAADEAGDVRRDLD